MAERTWENTYELTDEQFEREMAERRERLGLRLGDHLIGCPLCMADFPSQRVEANDQP